MTSVSKGIIWSGVERFSSQGIQFVLNIVIARILLPADYGLIGMLSIFLQVCQCLIDGGFPNALIQKKNRNRYDYGTVFLFNIIISLILYFILFLSAPIISRFYQIQQLTILLRVLGVNLIINALSSVQRTILTIEIDFRKQSIVSVVSAVVSGIIGVISAYSGLGVWSLVIQTLVNSSITSILFWVISNNYFPIWFKLDSFIKLGGYGLKLMSASLLHTLYVNMYSLVIGKYYSVDKLGYYTRSDQFVSYASSNVASVISRVAFPVFCKYQSNQDQLSTAYINFLKLSTFIIFPLMITMAVLSRQIIIVLLTEKWLPAANLFAILCIDGLWAPINNVNLSLLQSVGRSDLFLRLEIIKKIIAVVILFITVPYGLTIVCVGRVLYGLIALNINMFYTVRIINKTYLQQILIWLKTLFISIITGIIVLCSVQCIHAIYIQLIVGMVASIVIYLCLSYYAKVKELNYLKIFCND